VLFTIALSFVAVTHEVIAFAKQEAGIGEVAVGADGNRGVEIGLAIRSGGGGPGLPVAAEAPPSIDERAAIAASDAPAERPQTLDAGAPQAAAASDASMVVRAAATPRAVPANTSDRVTVAPQADQTAAPQVSLAPPAAGERSRTAGAAGRGET